MNDTPSVDDPDSESDPDFESDPEPTCPLVPDAGPRRARRLDAWTFDDDGDAETVTVPHTWNADQLTGDPAEYEQGEKCYRTTVEASDEAGVRRLLHFEGANQTTTVSVDGERIGTHRGGYTAFTFDVTDYLAAGETATVEVTVDNTIDDDVPPVDADFTFFGGLYRPVWLVETGDVCLDGSEYGASGVYVDAPSVSTESATVRVRAGVANHRESAASVDVTHRVRDGETTVAEFGSTVPVGAGGRRSVESVSAPIEKPQLWSLDDPHCYAVETTVEVDGTLLDRVESPLGIREIGLAAGRVTINGEPVSLRGTNRHQDRPGKGNALSDADHVDDVELIAQTGMNFLRLAHYPQSHTVLRAADERGILLWEEIPVINWVNDTPEFRANCRRRIKEMVRQHYNHPSVGMWGFMNEILLGYDMDYFEGFDEEDAAAALDVGTDLDELLREEDPTRLTAMACHGSWEYERFGFVDVPDVLGWNLYHGWYYGEVEYMGGALYEKLIARPEQATMVSEYGVGADVRLHTTEPEAWDFTEEYQQYYHEGYVAAFDEFPELAGTAQWNAFDFASDGRMDTIPGINQKGLTTHDREPKGVYHLYETWRSDDPVVHLATRHWRRRSDASANADGTHPITAYSNLPEVELFVDGDSQGVKSPDDGYAATWDVSLSSGTHDVRVTASEESDATVEDGTNATVADETTVELLSVAVDAAGTFPGGGLRINVGSHREIVTDDELWVPDRAAAERDLGWGAVGGEHVETLERVFETDLVPLYQHALDGLDAYRLDLPAGDYRVELQFCELDHEESGRRVFSVLADGELLAAGIDPVADGGVRTPLSVTEDVTVDGDDGLLLSFETEVGSALLSALRVERA